MQLYKSMMEFSIILKKERKSCYIFVQQKQVAVPLSLDLFWPMLFFANTSRVLAYLPTATIASPHTI
jgi:hypothetical protein